MQTNSRIPLTHYFGLPDHIEEHVEDQRHLTIISFNQFGTLLAGGCKGGDVILWSWETRTVVRIFSNHCYDEDVTAIVWDPCGKFIIAGNCVGSIAVWDVESAQLKAIHACGSRPIRHMSIMAENLKCVSGSEVEAKNVSLLVSFQNGPAQIVSIQRRQGSSLPGEENKSEDLPIAETIAVCDTKSIPALGFSDKSNKYALLLGTEASATGQTAIFVHVKLDTTVAPNHEGQADCIVFTASRGVISILRWPQMDFIDAVRIEGTPRICKLEVCSNNAYLLVTTDDRTARIFDICWNTIAPAIDYTNRLKREVRKHKNAKRALYPVDPEEMILRLGGLRPPVKGSLLFGPASSCLQLRCTFNTEKKGWKWRFNSFTMDGRYVISCLADENEHIIFLWRVSDGKVEAILQRATGPISSVECHPSSAPIQMLTLGKDGSFDIWTRTLSQPWNVYAPDFKVLVNNKKHLELETEFDIEINDIVKEKEKEASDLIQEANTRAEVFKPTLKSTAEHNSLQDRNSLPLLHVSVVM